MTIAATAKMANLTIHEMIDHLIKSATKRNTLWKTSEEKSNYSSNLFYF